MIKNCEGFLCSLSDECNKEEDCNNNCSNYCTCENCLFEICIDDNCCHFKKIG